MKLKNINTLKYRRQNFKYLNVYSKTGLFLLFLLLSLVIIGSIVRASRMLPKAPMISPVVNEPVSNVIPKEQTRWFRLYTLVRWYESNNGKKGLAVTCAKKGMVNEIGYLPYKGFCFQNKWDQELTFANWINKRYNYDGLTESQLLCLWNTGKAYKSCHYSNGNLAKAK